MGLDACVYCNCYETGRLHIPAPFPELIFIDENGAPEIRSDDRDQQDIFDEWRDGSPSACDHPSFSLIDHWIGNTSMVAALRDVFDMIAEKLTMDYSIIRNQVVYSDSHCGDIIPVNDISNLAAELDDISDREFIFLQENQNILLRRFLTQMQELARGALTVQKPIAF